MTDTQTTAEILAALDSDYLFAAFVRHHLATAFWADLRDDDGESLDSEYDVDDMDPESLSGLVSDCRAFWDANKALILHPAAPLASDFEGPIDERKAAMAGHDFWLTRQGHGAGFWDGDWNFTIGADEAGDVLTKASKGFGEVWLYVGDDGRVYVS